MKDETEVGDRTGEVDDTALALELENCVTDGESKRLSTMSDNCEGKAAGAGQAGQAQTGPLFLALGLVMIVNCIDRMVKIIT